jgi:hypothetical protein
LRKKTFFLPSFPIDFFYSVFGRFSDHLRDQGGNRAEVSPHPAPHGSSGQLGWAGGGPGGPTWSQGHLVRWRASPTSASASSFASSPYKWLAPGR